MRRNTRLAEEVMALDTEIGDTDAMIEERFRRHRHAEIILSMVILHIRFVHIPPDSIAVGRLVRGGPQGSSVGSRFRRL